MTGHNLWINRPFARPDPRTHSVSHPSHYDPVVMFKKWRKIEPKWAVGAAKAARKGRLKRLRVFGTQRRPMHYKFGRLCWDV